MSTIHEDATAGANRLSIEAAAREARAADIHWGFAPVVDIIYNFRAPESNIRTFGDAPEIVAAFASKLIYGLNSGERN